MFENLSGRLSDAARQLSGKGRLTETNIKDTLRQVRLALLEADVALPVVKTFIARIRERALGEEVGKSLTPGQALVKIIHGELVRILGSESAPLNLRAQPPVVILLAGLQGAGKTTTAAKLAKRLIDGDKKKVMLVSVDVHRPAAILQLQTLAGEVGALHCPSQANEKPTAIVARALDDARRSHADVLIVDTAGRLHIDGEMMQEVVEVHKAAQPHETLFVVDSMAGQDAVNSATAFNDRLPLTGIVLTKTDGDAKGGVALSVREVTGKPIRFMGIGEKVEALEAFHPDRMASRILGMGDVLTLVEEIEQKVSKDQTEKLAKKLKKGRGFDLSDLRDQLEQMMNMGGLASMLEKLPLPGNINPAALKDSANEVKIRRQIAIINSMTPSERRFPKTINGSRKKRIAGGAGQQIQDVNRLLKQHLQMEKMMKKVSKGGMKKFMRGMPGGGMPPGMR
ncbi:MAG: signal recognition particle protein [Gammaproteobacteria bacterium]|nr:signal recognition particle protein [Gammaproteobacteria bacterium]MBU2677276.1 signal recognition particle protein [Gammaproteobacteria bacterium]NNC56005.1 signal recognition particle protein [Woeseiaceae bacterium]NNL51007.1 signal recognition particle protein [Woeseiaceae bacterium]